MIDFAKDAQKFKKEQDTKTHISKKQKIKFLIGLPSVGKSTYIRNNDKGAYVINRDDIVNEVARELGWTYDDMFAVPIFEKLGDINPKFGEVIETPEWITWQDYTYSKISLANDEIFKRHSERISQALKQDRDIIIDMINLNSDIRNGMLKQLSGLDEIDESTFKDFEIEGIVFKVDDLEKLKELAHLRADLAKLKGQSKTIPDDAYDNMFKKFELPTDDEFFDNIEIIDVDKNLDFYISYIKTKIEDLKSSKDNKQFNKVSSI
jgi:predicted kinase